VGVRRKHEIIETCPRQDPTSPSDHLGKRPHPCNYTTQPKQYGLFGLWATPRTEASGKRLGIMVRVGISFCKIVAKTKINKVASLGRAIN